VVAVEGERYYLKDGKLVVFVQLGRGGEIITMTHMQEDKTREGLGYVIENVQTLQA